MTDLEIYSAYLPYEVQIEYKKTLGNYLIGFATKTPFSKSKERCIIKTFNKEFLNICPHDCKLILRPLSDITKEIEHNGDIFFPVERLLEENCFNVDMMQQEEIDSFSDSYKEDVFWNYWDARKLLSWHFDVFGLIEQGKAIDINDTPRT